MKLTKEQQARLDQLSKQMKTATGKALDAIVEEVDKICGLEAPIVESQLVPIPGDEE